MGTNLTIANITKSVLPYASYTSQISWIFHYLQKEHLKFHISNDNRKNNFSSKALLTSQHFFHALDSTIQVQQLKNPQTYLVLLKG